MIQSLFQEISGWGEVEALALGGSRAGGLSDAASDYDVYIYCTRPIAVETRKRVLAKYCTVMELGNSFWEYEDNCRLRSGTDIDILYRDLNRFGEEVAAVVEGFQPQNAYTTCMWHNLLTCEVLYDRDGRLTRLKERFSVPYPPQLRANILERGYRLLRKSMPAYEGQIRKAAKRGDLVAVGHRVTAFVETYFDILFALNGLTHPGEKRLVMICREKCGILPERFEENLMQLFRDQFSAPEQLAADLDRILAALEKILP